MPIIKFTLVNVDQFGSNNDSGVLPHLKISSAFENITLNLPESKVSNKPRLIFSSGRYNLDFCVRIQEGF